MFNNFNNETLIDNFVSLFEFIFADKKQFQANYFGSLLIFFDW